MSGLWRPAAYGNRDFLSVLAAFHRLPIFHSGFAENEVLRGYFRYRAELDDQAPHSGFEQGKDVSEVPGRAFVRVRDVLAVQAGDLTKEPDPVRFPGRSLGAHVAEVGGVHGENEVARRQPGRVELAGAMRLAVIAITDELLSCPDVHAVTDMPVAGARAVDHYATAKAGLAYLLAKDYLGHRRPADVAQADAADAVRAVGAPRRRQRRRACVMRHVIKDALETRPAGPSPREVGASSGTAVPVPVSVPEFTRPIRGTGRFLLASGPLLARR